MLLAPRVSDACAKAPPRGEEVQIAEEEALVVWDPATKTETFIRRARFSSTTKSFGFLVPTPTVPTLGEASEGIFYSLSDTIRPQVRYDRSGTTFHLGSLMWEACPVMQSKGDRGAAMPAAAVRVIATAHVAGFDATTLEADDPTALAGWLANHGFATTPELTAWLAHYVNDKWKMTAFVVSSDQKEGTDFELATRAVKMTFQTERPFYPYREPAEAPSTKLSPVTDRSLRIFFLSNDHYRAYLAEAPWHARVLFSARTQIHGDVSEVAGGTNFVLGVFVDDQAPRRGIDELYFAPVPSQEDIRQPPLIVHSPRDIVIPVDVILLVAFIGWRIAARRKRKKVSS